MNPPALPDATSTTTPPSLPGKPPKNWWDRNWKWVVPTVILIPMLMIGGCFMLIVGVLKSSDAYQQALQRATNAPEVVAAIGSPIEAGWIFQGNISTDGGGGEAALTIPISGPDGDATIYAEATKSLGLWHFDRMIVDVKATGQRIDLSESTATP